MNRYLVYKSDASIIAVMEYPDGDQIPLGVDESKLKLTSGHFPDQQMIFDSVEAAENIQFDPAAGITIESTIEDMILNIQPAT